MFGGDLPATQDTTFDDEDTPDTLIGRDTEFSEILSAVKQAITDRKGLSLYCYGKPGTGKTLTITHVIDELLRTKSVSTQIDKVYQTNAMTLKTPLNFFVDFCRDVNGQAYRNELQLFRAVGEVARRQTCVVFIDEIDTLIFKKQMETLYRIFELPVMTGSRMILLTISNSPNLPSSLLPELGLRGIRPQTYGFAPYTKPQVVQILSHKMQTEASAALQLCAQKISQTTGDIRTAMEIYSAADGSKEANPVAAVAKASGDIFMGKSTSIIQALPSQQKKLLALITSTSPQNGSILAGQVHSMYNFLSRRCLLQSLNFSDCIESLGDLAHYGLINVKAKAKRDDPRNHIVTLKTERDAILTALATEPNLEEFLSTKNRPESSWKFGY